jgi:hypothetical protein
MKNRTTAVVGLGIIAVVGGCENLPGSEREQGAVGGGVAGAVIGASVADKPLLGGLIGGAVGAAGGYLIGANWDKITGNDKEGAEEAVQNAQRDPASAQDARNARTADINNDGFVTIDEVTAMQDAGFSDEEMIDRLEATGQVFDLSQQNMNELRTKGVSQRVVNAMRTMNRDDAPPGAIGATTAADTARAGAATNPSP